MKSVDTKSVLPAALCALSLIPLLATLLHNRELWLDEAMLFQNFLAPASMSEYPFPYYSQAAPLGYLYINKLVLLFDDVSVQIFISRLISAAGLLTGALFLAAAARRLSGNAAALLAFLMVMTNPWLLRYGTEVKHYSFEFAVACFIIYVAAQLRFSDKTSALAGFLAVGVVGALFSFTYIVVLAAAFATVLILRFGSAPTRQLGAFLRQQSKFLIIGLISITAAAALHLTLTKWLTAYQFKSYADVYRLGGDGGGFIASKVWAAVSLVGYTLAPLLRGIPFIETSPIFLALPASALMLVAWIALPVSMAVSLFPIILLGITLAILFTLNLVGLLPVVSGRHFFFSGSIVLLCVAIGAAQLYEILKAKSPPVVPRIAAYGAAGVFVMAALLLTVRVSEYQRQNVGLLISEIESRPPAPVWVDCLAQPIVAIMKPASFDLRGMLDPSSNDVAWTKRGGCRMSDQQMYPPSYASNVSTALAGEKAAWMLFNHRYNNGIALQLEAATRAVGPCRSVIKRYDSELFYCAAPS